jgi:hypothetical protein
MGRGLSHPSGDTMRDITHGKRSRDEGYETVLVFRRRAVAIEPLRDYAWHSGRYASHTIYGKWGLILMSGVEMTLSFFWVRLLLPEASDPLANVHLDE